MNSLALVRACTHRGGRSSRRALSGAEAASGAKKLWFEGIGAAHATVGASEPERPALAERSRFWTPHRTLSQTRDELLAAHAHALSSHDDAAMASGLPWSVQVAVLLHRVPTLFPQVGGDPPPVHLTRAPTTPPHTHHAPATTFALSSSRCPPRLSAPPCHCSSLASLLSPAVRLRSGRRTRRR